MGKTETALKKTIEPTSQLKALLARVEVAKPAKADIEAIRQLFQAHPDLWRSVDLSLQVVAGIIGKAADNEAMRAVLWAGYDGLQRDLGRKEASPFERMLIDHVLLCLTRLQLAECQYTGCTAGSSTLAQAEFYEHRLSAVQRRYLRASETLARVRRLALPAVQVNIGEKQVNVVGHTGDAI